MHLYPHARAFHSSAYTTDVFSKLSFLQKHTSQMLTNLEQIVRLESPSHHKREVEAVLERIEFWMLELGVSVKRFSSENGDHRLFTLAGKTEHRILILAHADTVWPLGTLERLPFRVQDGRAYGPGIYDMKAGVVQALWALKSLEELPCTVQLLVTSDEEVGSVTSRDLITQTAQGAKAVLVVEPSMPVSGHLKTARKGGGEFHIRIEGVAAHAGLEPEKGVNALLELSHQALHLTAIARPDLGTTMSVGRMTGGGPTNVVPAHAELWADLRVSTLEEAARVQREAASLSVVNPRAKLTLTGGMERMPLERGPGTVALFELAREVALELGFTLGEGLAGGMSDGNLTAPIAPTLDGLGAVGDGAHADHEHVVIDQMPIRAALLAGLIERIAAS